MSGMNVVAKVVLVVVFVGLGSCRRTEQDAESALDEAAATLRVSAFGEDYDKAIAVAGTLAGQTQDLATAYRARLIEARAHLDLFFAAVLTGDGKLYTKVKKELGWELEKDLFYIRNFQVLVQDILEEFRLIEREAGAFPELQEQAAALALFTHGLQSIYYRDKERYFSGRKAVAAFEQYRYLDDLASVRDLVFETLQRAKTPGANWRNVVLTVFGRLCPPAAGQAIVRGCLPGDPTNAPEHCPTDRSQLAAVSWGGAVQALKGCRSPEIEDGPQGLDALRAHYDAAYERLVKSEGRISPVFISTVKAMRADMDKAYGALEKLLE